MSLQFKSYPIDIILCMIWSLLLLPITFLNLGDIASVVIGLPYLLFIPGYILIYTLFPVKTQDNGITRLTRIGLSFGCSIAIVSLIGILLNITPWGIQLLSVLFSLFILIESLGLIALYRWKITPADKRYIISINFSPFKFSTNLEKILTIFVFLSIFLALSSIVYLIVEPKMGETFTDFYILNQNKEAVNFPQDISVGKNTSLLLGLINHEYKTMSYTIEIWLIQESRQYNTSKQENETIYQHAWFMKTINITLDPSEITNKENQTIGWEYNYTFAITKIGYYKLAFLLFTTPSERYNPLEDYSDSIELRINNAYRELHVWLYVG
jgi:uncharacterized membrane protein